MEFFFKLLLTKNFYKNLMQSFKCLFTTGMSIVNAWSKFSQKALVWLNFVNILTHFGLKNPFLFFQHVQRTFYGPDGRVLKEESSLWVQPMDYIGIQPLKKIPFYKDIKLFNCDGSYCGLPYFYAMRKIIR